jgi:hypothetical protein
MILGPEWIYLQYILRACCVFLHYLLYVLSHDNCEHSFAVMLATCLLWLYGLEVMYNLSQSILSVHYIKDQHNHEMVNKRCVHNALLLWQVVANAEGCHNSCVCCTCHSFCTCPIAKRNWTCVINTERERERDFMLQFKHVEGVRSLIEII